jgi:hypothetical protein
MSLNVRTSLFASCLLAVVSATQDASGSSIVTEWLDQTIPAAKQTAWEPTHHQCALFCLSSRSDV